MDVIRAQLLAVVAAAIICGIVTRLFGEKGTQGALAKMICGLFLTFTLLHPIGDFRIGDIGDIADRYSAEADQAVSAGMAMTKDALRESIKARSEAYILDKAEQMHAELTVRIGLSEDDIPVPQSIKLTGKISPYTKNRLQTIIEENLGIDKEHQEWT